MPSPGGSRGPSSCSPLELLLLALEQLGLLGLLARHRILLLLSLLRFLIDAGKLLRPPRRVLG
eukprot:12085170-Alexandrium_andersonii.AAC.1